MKTLAPTASIRGFTIVELMVALAVAAVLIGMALPAFNTFIEQRTMTSRVNDMVVAITYARSEAARLGGLVSVRAANPDAANEWGAGYCVAQGTPADCSGVVLRRYPALDEAVLNGVGDLDGVDVLTFNSRGMLTLGSQGAIELCSTEDGVNRGRVVNVSMIGRAVAADLECS